VFREPTDEDEAYIDDLYGFTGYPPEEWAVIAERSTLWVCDECVRNGYPPERAQYVHTESEHAWCVDCIEHRTAFNHAMDKDD
jgi:hypothetical protein